MATRKKLTPRKLPKQERSQATVDAILQAVTYILIKGGWAALTTNEVAKRAGVNIASLYQFFPNKEAIVVELQRRHVAQARAQFPRALPTLQAQPTFGAALRLMIEAGVQEHRVAPALHRVFSEELPRSTRQPLDGEGADQAAWRELAKPFLKHLPHPELAGFIARVATHAAIHEAAIERPELLGDPAFVDELVLLLERYLVREAPKKAAKRPRGTK